MGAYVKGMKKPKSCDFCPISLPHVAELRCGFDLDHCSITEIPPHRRLIDADDIENITVIMNENGSGFNRIIAPIIIEAEEGET